MVLFRSFLFMSFGLSETVLTASYDHTKLDADDYEKEVCVQFIQWQHSSTFFWTTYFFPRLVHTSPFCHYRIFGRSAEEKQKVAIYDTILPTEMNIRSDISTDPEYWLPP